MFKDIRKGFLYSGDSGGGSGSSTGDNGSGGSGGGDGGDKGAGGGETPTFDTYYAGLDATTKGLIDSHVSGLKTALDSERKNGKTLAQQVKELAEKADEGSDSKAALEAMSAQLAEANRKAQFFDAAAAKGVKNINLAYVAAKEEGLFDSNGACNFEALKGKFPELYSPAAGGGGGGDAGSGSSTTQSDDINAAIRRAAGRG